MADELPTPRGSLFDPTRFTLTGDPSGEDEFDEIRRRYPSVDVDSLVDAGRQFGFDREDIEEAAATQSLERRAAEDKLTSDEFTAFQSAVRGEDTFLKIDDIINRRQNILRNDRPLIETLKDDLLNVDPNDREIFSERRADVAIDKIPTTAIGKGLETGILRLFESTEMLAAVINHVAGKRGRAEQGIRESDALNELIQARAIGDDESFLLAKAPSWIAAQVPIMISIMAGAGIGALAQKGLTGIAKEALSKELKTKIGKKIAKKLIDLEGKGAISKIKAKALKIAIKRGGGVVGAAAAGTALETSETLTGQIQIAKEIMADPKRIEEFKNELGVEGRDLRETDFFQPGTAVAFGAIGGALEFITPFGIAGKFIPKNLKKELKRKTVGAFLKHIFKEGAKSTVTEGLTEGAQTVIKNEALRFLDKHRERFSPKELKELKDSVIQGAVVGKAFGVVSGGAEFIAKPLAKPKAVVAPEPKEEAPEVVEPTEPKKPTEEPVIEDREAAEELFDQKDTATVEELETGAEKLQSVLTPDEQQEIRKVIREKKAEVKLEVKPEVKPEKVPKVPKEKPTGLQALTRPKLRAMAKKEGITIKKGLNKAQLINAIEKKKTGALVKMKRSEVLAVAKKEKVEVKGKPSKKKIIQLIESARTEAARIKEVAAKEPVKLVKGKTVEDDIKFFVDNADSMTATDLKVGLSIFKDKLTPDQVNVLESARQTSGKAIEAEEANFTTHKDALAAVESFQAKNLTSQLLKIKISDKTPGDQTSKTRESISDGVLTLYPNNMDDPTTEVPQVMNHALVHNMGRTVVDNQNGKGTFDGLLEQYLDEHRAFFNEHIDPLYKNDINYREITEEDAAKLSKKHGVKIQPRTKRQSDLLKMEELMAFKAEDGSLFAVKGGIINKIVNAVKTGLNKTFGTNFNTGQVEKMMAKAYKAYKTKYITKEAIAEGTKFSKVEATQSDTMTSLDGKIYGPIFFPGIIDYINKKFQGKSMPTKQFLAFLNKAPQSGVKQEELDVLGLEVEFADQDRVTKAEVMEAIEQNHLVIEDVILGHDQVTEELTNLVLKSREKRTDAFNELQRGLRLELSETEMDKLDAKFQAAKEANTKDEKKLSETRIMPTKFQGYSMEGGINYFEHLLQLPQSETKNKFLGGPTAPLFRSSHWEQLNVVAHIRGQEFLDTTDNRVLFLDELQSDWHQEGREKGFNIENAKKIEEKKIKLQGEIDNLKADFNQTKDKIKAGLTKGMEEIGPAAEQSLTRQIFKLRVDQELDVEWRAHMTPEIAVLAKNLRETFTKMSGIIGQLEDLDFELAKLKGGGIPDVPFKKNRWIELSVKRMIRKASEEGFDKVAIIDGKTSAKRYDLRDKVGLIQLNQFAEHSELSVFGHSNNLLAKKEVKNVDDVAGIIGKDLAAKLYKKEPNQFQIREIKGGDLEVGGEGMIAFYDKIIPSIINKYIKKWGEKVAPVKIAEGARIKLDFTGEALSSQEIEQTLSYDFDVNLDDFGAVFDFRVYLTQAETSEEVKPNFIRALEEYAHNSGFERAQLALTQLGLDESQLEIIGEEVVIKEFIGFNITDQMREDALIIGQSQFSKVPKKPTKENKVLNSLLDPSKAKPSRDKPVDEKATTPEQRLELSDKELEALELSPAMLQALKGALEGTEVNTEKEIKEAFGPKKIPEEKIMSFYQALAKKEESSAKGIDDKLKKESKIKRRLPIRKILDKLPELGPQRNDLSWVVPEETRWQVLVRGFQDNLNRLKLTQETIQDAGGSIPDQMNPYMLEESSHGRTQEKIDSFRERFETPMIKKIKKSKLELIDIESYLYARHAKERNEVIAKRNPRFALGGGSGMTDVQADEILANIKNRGLLKKMQSVEKDVRAIRESYLDLLVDSGLERPETTQLWRDTYKNYVPLKGLDTKKGKAEDLTGGNLGGRRFVVAGPNSKIALGRQSRATNLLGNLMAQYEDAIIRSERNKIGNAFLQMVNMFPNKEVWTVEKRTAIPKLNKMGIVEYTNVMIPDKNRLFVTKIEGDDVNIQIEDPILAGQMNGVTQPVMGKIVAGMAKTVRILAGLNTQWNPRFILTNFQRDVYTAAVNTSGIKEGGYIAAAKVVTKVVRSVPEIFIALSTRRDTLAGKFLKQLPGIKGKVDKWQARFRDFSEAGGQTSFIDFIDIESRAKRIDSLINRGVLKESFFEVGRILSDLNTAVELASRLSLYDTLRNNGVNKVRAASAAKNVTVNFNKRGEYGVILNSLYMFANAGVQGGTVLMRTLNPKNKNAKKAWALVGAMAAMGYGLAMLNRIVGGKDPEDDEYYYDKIPDWVRDNQMILFYGPGKYINLWRLPYGYNIFHVMGDSLYDMTMTDKGVARSAKRVMSSILDSFNPLGTSDATWAQNLTPTLIRPITQIAINENFYGGPIMPDERRFGKKLAPHQRYFSSVSDVSKFLTDNLAELSRTTGFETLDMSPETIDHVFAYYTGGLGKTILDSISIYYKQAKAEKGVDVEPQIREFPFQSLFKGEVLPVADRTEYFETIDEIEADKMQFANLKKENGLSAALQFKKDSKRNRLNLSTIMLAKVKRSRKLYSKLSKRINRLKLVNNRIRQKQKGFAKYFDLGIDSELFKRNIIKIEALNKKKDTIAKRFNAFYKKRKEMVK